MSVGALHARWSGIAALIAGALVAACGARDEPPSAASAAQTAAQRAAGHTDHGQEGRAPAQTPDGIDAAPAKRGALSRHVVATATVHQDHHRLAQVASRVPARIARILVHQGDQVVAGTPLAVLDSPEVADAQLAAAQARTQLELSRAERDRIAPLVAEEVLPAKDLLRVEADLAKARAAADAAAARLKLLNVGSDHDSAGTFAVRAPIAGIVAEKNAVLGELAQPDRPLFVVADLSRVWVEANLTDRELARVRVGASAEVGVEAYPGERFEGKVTFVSMIVDQNTRTAVARIEVPNPGGKLRPLMFATARIEASGAAAGHEALLVPEAALVRINGEPAVFVKAGDEFEPRFVEEGARAEGMVEIRMGLDDGELVATTQAYTLKARLLKSQLGDTH